MKKIIAINGSPRGNWNTADLVREAAKGAESAGAVTEVIDLYKLDKFTGCVSCFGCKLEKTFGRCVCQDGLTEVLEKIRNADGLIIGSPIYLGDMTAGFRAIYERLIFQYLTYNREQPCCNDKQIPVVFIVTSNCPEANYEKVGYTTLIAGYERTFGRFIGPVKTVICSDTLQVNDYSKYNWTNFDPEHKKQRREEIFPQDLAKAFACGAEMVK